MKILLVYMSGEQSRNDPYISLVPTGLCYLHACLIEAGYDCVLANFSGWSRARIERELLRQKPELIGISQWTHNRHISLELAARCRRLFPSSIIVMGGGHATFCYEDILVDGSPVDVVIRGEAEQSLLELVGHLANGTDWRSCGGLAFRQDDAVTVNAPRMPISRLDDLPQPARYFDRSIGLDIQLQPEFIVTARGCPSACHFCSSPAFWGRKVRFRSPQNIVDEIQFVRRHYGLIYFSIRDDTFTADRNRAVEFCTLLIEQNANILWNCQSRVNAIDEELLVMMKRAGCECIQLGVESGSPRILKQLGKTIDPAQIEQACLQIRDIGINLSIYLISDVPGETAEDLQQTVELIRRIHPDDGYVSPLAFYPGTRLHSDAVLSGITSKDIFAATDKNALYVSKQNGSSAKKLLSELSGSHLEDSGRFTRQKTRLGYCYTTNVLAGEWYRQRGKYKVAEKEFMEITVRQPENPWGWFLLGELCQETGDVDRALDCFRAVIKLVPKHAQTLQQLRHKKTGP
ncbi:MAG: radical SAM protein [Geobacter sp.]|nr:radical SAM protein [Geobacter sp.]